MTASRETVLAKMKEKPAQIKKSQVKIKVSNALFVFCDKRFVMCLIQLYNVLDNAFLGGSFTNLINIPSSAVNYFHLLVVVVPATFTVARILHPTLLPVYEFRNGFLLFEAKKFPY